VLAASSAHVSFFNPGVAQVAFTKQGWRLDLIRGPNRGISSSASSPASPPVHTGLSSKADPVASRKVKITSHGARIATKMLA